MTFTWFASAYDTDDATYRLLTMVQMVGVLVLAAGVPGAAQGDFTTITMGYVVMRAGLIALWARAALEHPERRRTCLRYAIGIAAEPVGAPAAAACVDGFASFVQSHLLRSLFRECCQGGSCPWMPITSLNATACSHHRAGEQQEPPPATSHRLDPECRVVVRRDQPGPVVVVGISSLQAARTSIWIAPLAGGTGTPPCSCRWRHWAPFSRWSPISSRRGGCTGAMSLPHPMSATLAPGRGAVTVYCSRCEDGRAVTLASRLKRIWSGVRSRRGVVAVAGLPLPWAIPASRWRRLWFSSSSAVVGRRERRSLRQP
jgi:hypothetical protein